MVKALVLYHSQQYGNTEAMAKAVAEGLKQAGATVTLHNANDHRYPIEEYGGYDLVAVGTPDYFSYVAGTLKTFMDDWYINRAKPGYQGKQVAVFYSHGGGGRARDSLSLFDRLGTRVGSPVESHGKPDSATLAKCVELGRQLAGSA